MKCRNCDQELKEVYKYGPLEVCLRCKLQLESEVGYSGLRRILDK